MNIEMPSKNKPKETGEDSERAKAVEEIFKKYHKDLTRWCIYKLKKSGYSNPERDAEEILAHVYQKLLIQQNPLDFNRKEHEIQKYLNIHLDHAIASFYTKNHRKKRIPPEILVSLEEMSEKEKEKSMPRQEFINPIEELKHENRLEQILTEFEKKDKRLAEIIRKRWLEGKTLREVGNEINLSRERVRQLEDRGLVKLKKIAKLQSK
ncbi:sigma-70 family RNA polymerase sigma factor [Candidatus Nomurabacteria bacterium]|nr:sigma-70 family RNA polymerase sigma factor [Candidatus Nomurabacteria bacterium]